jgi:hypothetical protein
MRGAKRRLPDLQLTDDTGRIALVLGGWSWSVACVDTVEHVCKAKIHGYDTRAQAIRGAEGHLRWHVNGKPTCEDCGAWLGYKSSKRCRKGTCEVSR